MNVNLPANFGAPDADADDGWSFPVNASRVYKGYLRKFMS
jgi:hypothetical protein